MITVRYIGNFPPPYGGVTIKNQLLYNTLSKDVKIKRIKRMPFMPSVVYQLFNILLALTERYPLIVGISSRGGKSKMITRFLYYFNRKTMKKSLYFMMGGLEAKRIAENLREIKWYKNYKQIYVETETMLNTLEAAGLDNVKLFPNCRNKILNPPLADMKQEADLKCVFFSRIEYQKGVDLILKIAKETPDIRYYFYGPIAHEYENEFENAISDNKNVYYKGVFRGNNEDIYNELKKYDILLFPTRWKNEGVPGILVEAKMAGLAIIASNQSYNAEIVKDGVEGIILKETSASNLLDAIRKINENRDLLVYMKKNSYTSSEKFCVEKYRNEILNALEVPGGYKKKTKY